MSLAWALTAGTDDGNRTRALRAGDLPARHLRLVRLLRDAKLQTAWHDAIDAGAIASCYPQRTEFLYSARDGRYQRMP